MGKIPVRITILKSSLGNSGAAKIVGLGTTQRVGPDSRDSRAKYRSPHPSKDRRDNSDRSSRGYKNPNNRSGFTTVSFHINGPDISTFLIDTDCNALLLI